MQKRTPPRGGRSKRVLKSANFAEQRSLAEPKLLATRILVRTVLSRYARVGPAEWQFSVGKLGKPRIRSPQITPALHFNLAHTPGLVACIVSSAHAMVGVDVKRIGRAGNALEIAKSYFATSELRDLQARSGEDRARRFVQYWTLKESFAKARGVGLTMPLDHACFQIRPNGIDVAFDVMEHCWSTRTAE